MAVEFTPLEWRDTDDPVDPATSSDPHLDAATLNAREQLVAQVVETVNALLADAGQTELDLAAKADLVGGTVPDAQIPAGVTRDSELASAIAAVIDGAPDALNTFLEVANRITSDESALTALTDLVGQLPFRADNVTTTAAEVGQVVAVTGTAPLAYGLTEIPAPEVTQAELDSGLAGKADTTALTGHTGDTANPHGVTKAQVGLGSVDDVAAASLRDRATHTGTQPSTSIADFTEAVQDAVAALLGAGSNVTLNYDDAAGTLTVSATGAGGTGLDAEQVRDTIGVALVGTGVVAVAVNDAADTITISSTATANATDAALRDRSTHTGTQAASTITGLTKSSVGLSNVDNTADSAKPVSTAQQAALDGKQALDSDLTALAALSPANDAVVQRKSGAWTSRTPAQVLADLPTGHVSPIAYGAAGDGTTDDTAAVQAAINTGRPVAIDRPYRVGGLTLASNTALYGGAAGRLIRPAASVYTASINPGSGGSADPATNIAGVRVVGVTFDDDVVANPFRQNDAQLNLNACSDVVVDGCRFLGPRSDAIYLGSSNTGATERHNQRVTVTNCLFDGINKDNRNAISVVDCAGLLVHGNTFRRMSRADMPGCIDIEPNSANTFAILRDFRITGNRFDDVGGSACIGTLLQPISTYTSTPGDWKIDGNTFVNIGATNNPINLLAAASATDGVSTTLAAAAAAAATTISTVGVVPVGAYITIAGAPAESRLVTAVTGAGPYTLTLATALGSAHSSGAAVTSPVYSRQNISVRNNSATGVLRLGAFDGFRGVRVAGNEIAGSTRAVMVGSSYASYDVVFDRNEFYRCASADGGGPGAINIVKATYVKIDGNTFIDCGLTDGTWGMCLVMGGPGASNFVDFVGTNTMRVGTRMTSVTYKSSSHTKGANNTYTAPIGAVGTSDLP